MEDNFKVLNESLKRTVERFRQVNIKRYSKKYDAYYDLETGEWLEPVCGNEDCRYCKDRPPTAC